MQLRTVCVLVFFSACTGGAPPVSTTPTATVTTGTVTTGTVTTGTVTTTVTAPSTAVVEVVDEILQAAAPATDVLLVVDPESAAPGLGEAVGEALPMLLDYGLGSGTRWHVGVMGTGLGDPATLGEVHWIDLPLEPSPIADLLVGLAADGVGPFGAFGALQAALDGGGPPGFLQAGAPLHVLVIAGADDATPGLVDGEFSSWLAGSGLDVHWSVFAPAGSAAYEDLAASFPGDVFDSAAVPLEDALDEAGLAASGLTRRFGLSTEPVQGTISVEVHHKDVKYVFDEGTDWTYEASTKTVEFVEYVPEAGSTVQLRYTAL
jgi:hypothetical protein